MDNITIALKIQAINATLNEVTEQYATYKINVNNFYQLVNGMWLLFGGTGFAFIEYGTVSANSEASILLKNYVAIYAGCMAYWIFGFALAFGSQTNPMAGTRAWAGEGMDMTQYANWFYQMSFSTTSASIVSVATAERGYLLVDIAFAFYMTGLVFPVLEHWAWDPSGWLKKGDGNIGYEDFSGSGIINASGGAAAVVAALIIGPRLGRFETFQGLVRPRRLQVKTVPLLCIVAYVMTVATIAFNESSTTTISEPGDGQIASNAVRNTMITSCFSACTGFITYKVLGQMKYGKGRWSLKIALNALLTGVFASQCNCEAIYDWGAMIIGIASALGYLAVRKIVSKLKIDDVADAIPVHFGGGIVGVILRPFFKMKDGILIDHNMRSFKALGWQVAGLASFSLWSGTWTAAFYIVLRIFNLHRVPIEEQIEGLDIRIDDSELTRKKRIEAQKQPPPFIANLSQKLKELPPSPDSQQVFLSPLPSPLFKEDPYKDAQEYGISTSSLADIARC